jgi:hypothetical protein
LRDRQAERLGGLEIDHQFKFGWLLNREICRTDALEDAVNIGCRLRVRGDGVHHRMSSRPGLGRMLDDPYDPGADRLPLIEPIGGAAQAHRIGGD